jgi:hypothetical protein
MSKVSDWSLRASSIRRFASQAAVTDDRMLARPGARKAGAHSSATPGPYLPGVTSVAQ